MQKLPETKKLKPNGLDSRFRGNDGISVSVRINLDSHLRGNDGILDWGIYRERRLGSSLKRKNNGNPKNRIPDCGNDEIQVSVFAGVCRIGLQTALPAVVPAGATALM